MTMVVTVKKMMMMMVVVVTVKKIGKITNTFYGEIMISPEEL